MKPSSIRLLVALGVLSFGACSTLEQAPAPASAESASALSVGDDQTTVAVASAPTEPEAAAKEMPVEYGSFTREQLNQVIISELGARRGRIPESAQTYFELAQETRDTAIIRRALQFASVAGDTARMLELGQLWTAITPDDMEPHLLLGYQFLDNGNFDQALNHMIRVLELGGDVDFTALTSRTQDLPASQRTAIRQQLVSLRERFPDEDSIQYAVVQLLSQDGDTEGALRELALQQERFGESAQLTLVRAQLLQGLGQDEQVLETLRAGVERFPGSRLLRYSYAQVLVQHDELDEARAQFTILVEQQPEDYETLYSLALLNMEMEALDEARRIFTRMLDVGYRNNDSRFYMGYINERQGEVNAAIGEYRQVQMDSPNFLNAQRQVIRLLVSQGRYNEAHQWATRLGASQPRLQTLFVTLETEALMAAGEQERAGRLLDDALSDSPDDVDLLFARTLWHEQRADLDAAEVDLRRIIALDPDNARALNHLGYSLADRTDRHEEALALIERAIALQPDDPAIIDSLGWAQYKLGQYDQALDNLSRALELFPDHEVAAHLGEVLWVMGREQEALDVWREALEDRPDSDLLRNVMERFGVEPDS